MKKEAQGSTTQPSQPTQLSQMGGKPILEVKKLEIQDVINKSLAQFAKTLQQTQQQMTQQIAAQLNKIVLDLNKEVTNKLNQIRGPTITGPAMPAANDQYSAKDHHLGPRGKKQNPKLPDFWRRNFDYGESPYMHLDEIKTITDRPRLSKRRK